jgi:hypothetical protein
LRLSGLLALTAEITETPGLMQIRRRGFFEMVAKQARDANLAQSDPFSPTDATILRVERFSL